MFADELEGNGLTKIFVVSVPEQPLASVRVNVYTPLFDVVEFVICGLGSPTENPAGPVHA